MGYAIRGDRALARHAPKHQIITLGARLYPYATLPIFDWWQQSSTVSSDTMAKRILFSLFSSARYTKWTKADTNPTVK
jgi:hypothetical protein